MLFLTFKKTPQLLHTLYYSHVLSESKLVYLSKKIHFFALLTLFIQGSVLAEKNNIKVTQCMEVEKNHSGVHVSRITDLKADVYTTETRKTFGHKLFFSNHLPL